MDFRQSARSWLIKVLQIRLVILNSIWFPFQTSNLTQARRTTLLARVRQVLARLCSSFDIAVSPQLYAAHRHCHLLIRLEEQIVITTQLATKLLNPDGSPASFDSGSRAVLVPQLGKSVQFYTLVHIW